MTWWRTGDKPLPKSPGLNVLIRLLLGQHPSLFADDNQWVKWYISALANTERHPTSDISDNIAAITCRNRDNSCLPCLTFLNMILLIFSYEIEIEYLCSSNFMFISCEIYTVEPHISGPRLSGNLAIRTDIGGNGFFHCICTRIAGNSRFRIRTSILGTKWPIPLQNCLTNPELPKWLHL